MIRSRDSRDSRQRTPRPGGVVTGPTIPTTVACIGCASCSGTLRESTRWGGAARACRIWTKWRMISEHHGQAEAEKQRAQTEAMQCGQDSTPWPGHAPRICEYSQ